MTLVHVTNQAINCVITFNRFYWINFKNDIRGSEYMINGTNITEQIEDVNLGSFVDNISIYISPLDYITNDMGSVFFKVLNFVYNSGINLPERE